MVEHELCPLCGVPLDDPPGPVLEGDCPVHGVVNRLKGVDDRAPLGLLGQEADSGLSVWSADFEETLPVGTAGWRRVDAFDVSEDGDARGFSIVDEEDSFRSTQKLRYPDGATLEAHGMAHEGGEARFRLEGLQPGHDALLIERTDVMYAGGDVRLRVGERSITFPDFAPDRRYRARNRVVPIPGAWITDETLEVGLGRLESTKDLSHFAVWVYQSRTPDPGAWGGEDEETPADAVEADPPLEDSLGGGTVEQPVPTDEVPGDEVPTDAVPTETVDIHTSSLIEPLPGAGEPPAVIEPPLGRDESLAPVEPAPIPEAVAVSPAAPEPEAEPGPEPEAEPDPQPTPAAPPEPSPSPEPAPSTAATQKLITITLADADPGGPRAHLADELEAGWRIARLECLSGPGGGWLVVLLER